MTNRPSIVAGRGLTRHRTDGGPPILDHVDFDLFADDRVGLIGTSGSGKSSLFRVLVKLDSVDSGEVRYHDKALLNHEIPAFRRKVIYLPQRPSFVSASVRENLLVPLRLGRHPRTTSDAVYMSWLDAAGKPTSFLDQDVASLSGGEQQIVSLLRAIQLQPEVLLLDEPTASLDVETTTNIERIIDTWFGESGERAYAWTSHNSDQITRRTDRQVTLHHGRVS